MTDLLIAIFAIIGIVLMFAGGITYTIATFRKGLFWGIGNLVLPFVGVVFLVAHWQVAWKPFICGLGGTLLFAGAIAAYTVAHPEIQQQLKDPFSDMLLPGISPAQPAPGTQVSPPARP